MYRLNIQKQFRTGSEIEQMVSRIQECVIPVQWYFRCPDEDEIIREKDDLGNVYFQIGRTFGSRGEFGLLTQTESDAIVIRLLFGV